MGFDNQTSIGSFEMDDGVQKRPKRMFCCRILCFMLLLVGAAFLVFIGVVLGRAAVDVTDVFQRRVIDNMPQFINASQEEILTMASRLGQGIKFKTVSHESGHQELEEMAKLLDYVDKAYPNIAGADFIEKRVVNGFSLIYRVQGSHVSPESSSAYMLSAHLDVVPEGNKSLWHHDPFLGELVEDDGVSYIYGRGAIDMKHMLFGILEALEHRLLSNDRPERTFYITIGHDEEIGGHNGAVKILAELQKWLEEHGETIDFILDEGTPVTQRVMPGTTDPMINIGVAEKGEATLKLTARDVQLHSSFPGKTSAVGTIAEAVTKLYENPLPSRFGGGPEYEMIQYMSPHTPFIRRIATSNLWLFSSLVSSILEGDPTSDALQRTTTAVTVLKAGFKNNVIPAMAEAVVNHRIHTADSIQAVLDHDQKVINNPRVDIEVMSGVEPSAVSPYGLEVSAFQVIANSALEVYPQGHVVPIILVAMTDSRHYTELTDKIYRFSPNLMFKEDLPLFHGIGEKISVHNFNRVVEFYFRLTKNADIEGAC